jgi:hypothetical protein
MLAKSHTKRCVEHHYTVLLSFAWQNFCTTVVFSMLDALEDAPYGMFACFD